MSESCWRVRIIITTPRVHLENCSWRRVCCPRLLNTSEYRLLPGETCSILRFMIQLCFNDLFFYFGLTFGTIQVFSTV